MAILSLDVQGNGGKYALLSKAAVPEDWSNKPADLSIPALFRNQQVYGDVAWKAEQELQAAKSVQPMLHDGDNTYILVGRPIDGSSGLVFMVYNEISQGLLKVQTDQGGAVDNIDTFLEEFQGNVGNLGLVEV